MFQVEALHNPVVDKIISRGVSGFINILPLDKIPVGLPKNWTFKPTCIPELYSNRAEDFANFKVREDDVWVITYPKCGTTWTQEMAWMLMNNMDFAKANSVDITERSIFFELNGMAEVESWDAFEAVQNQKSPRVIKTHLPIGLLPRDIWRKKCKIIYVTRNPKDVVVSFFHHFISMVGFKGSIEEFTDAFVTDQISYCSFWNHVLEFWMIREVENVLFFTYEDMKEDLKAIIDRACEFLGTTYTEEQIYQLIDHLSFEKMKANPTCNNQGLVKCLYEMLKTEYKDETAFQFMRKGQVGGYKKELPQRCIDKINAKTKEVFQPHGLDLYCKDD